MMFHKKFAAAASCAVTPSAMPPFMIALAFTLSEAFAAIKATALNTDGATSTVIDPEAESLICTKKTVFELGSSEPDAVSAVLALNEAKALASIEEADESSTRTS
jgi:hypothetical protein